MPEPTTPDNPESPESTEPPESDLAREHRLLRTLIDLIPAMLYVKDAQSRFLVCNVAVAQAMGTTPAEAIGKTDFDFLRRKWPRPSLSMNRPSSARASC